MFALRNEKGRHADAGETQRLHGGLAIIVNDPG
jgi:hypothetical protein